ncbi:riboflavin synthase subunit alpha [Patescibacteria group bacterium]|nr:riboflavin synthase subunit alpha [Patescibacteria group bacterium]MBU1722061.1 riboflavin synthase subunit alpha [Patescibacteria group bacterium]MBU1901532.1 riboflavin synthase subunit alpha [Patescibacteria group bacterium]
MFTGIVRGNVQIQLIDKKEGICRMALLFDNQFLLNIVIGASVAVDGVCLTIVEIEGNIGYFDVMEETLLVTTLGKKVVGDYVNVERAAHMGDEIGGHLLSGHIATQGEVVAFTREDHDVRMTIHVDEEWMKYMLHKGFIAIDGISLTVVEPSVQEGLFQLCLIPETLEKTGLGKKQIGDKVNIEIDPMTQAIVDTTERVLAKK